MLLLTIILILAAGYMFLFDLLIQFDFSSIWYIILFIILVIVSIILGFFTLLLYIRIHHEIVKKRSIDDMRNHRFCILGLKFVMLMFNVKMNVEGLENIPKDKNFVIYSNHQEIWDVFCIKILVNKVPLAFISKESLFTVPLLGIYLRLVGNIPISRSADKSAARAIIQGVNQIKKGMPMAIFPEGKRTFSNEMIDFKSGAFKLAMKPKTDILPVTVYDMGNVLKKWPKRQHVCIKFHEIYSYEQYKGLSSAEVSDNVKAIIQTGLDDYKIKK